MDYVGDLRTRMENEIDDRMDGRDVIHLHKPDYVTICVNSPGVFSVDFAGLAKSRLGCGFVSLSVAWLASTLPIV